MEFGVLYTTKPSDGVLAGPKQSTIGIVQVLGDPYLV